MRRLASNVRVTAEDGSSVVLGPSDDVPEWAVEQITNPDAWASEDVTGEVVDDSTTEVVEAVPGVPVPAGDDARPDYAAMRVTDLRALIAERNQGRTGADVIPDDGRKDELVAALEADDA